MIKQKTTTKITILPNATKKFKTEVGKLLNDLMKDYGIKGKDEDFEKAFKNTFKSNLYYIIDNHYELKHQKGE